MIDIFRVTGGTETVLCRVADSSASVVNELMGREEVTVNVVVESPLPVKVGDFVRIDATVYTLNREPDFEKVSDVEYRYNLLFESPLYRMLDKLFTNPLTGISKFSVSRTLSEFVRLLTENMNKIDSGWSVSEDIPASEPKNLTFDAVSCREVLNRLSGEFGAEYFLTGKTIHFTERIENKTNLVFEQGKGKGLYSIGQEPVDSENTVTRIFPYGGTQNMTPGKGDASGRLFLPEGYLENFSEYSKVVEKEVEFQDVFPRFSGSADSVSGEFNNVIRCSSINFDVEKQAVGDTKVKINFLSGDLMGESFEFGWNNTNKEVTLIRKEDETALPGKDGKRPLIPHALKKAKSGDSFNFTDLVMPDEYMASAIVDLRAKATEWLAYYSRSRVKYSLEVDHRYLRGKRTLKAGDLVTIKIPETGTEKLLRVVSAERNLDTGKLTCTVSNYLDEKWSKKIEGAISDLKSNVTGSGSCGGLKIDILKENDLTPASDLNIYSSKRSVKEIGDRLSRVKADSSEGHITFKKGITVEGGTITDTLTASGKVVASDMEAGNNIKSKTAEVSEKSVTGTLQVKGIATATDMEIANHVKTKTVEVTSKAQAGELEVTGNAKLNSLNVSGKTVTGTIDVAGLSKSGNSEVVNLSQTKDLEVAELARTRDLVVTRLAEVLNLSVTDVATLARAIVKESISSETFIPGFAGEGFKIWQLAGGDWTGEFDSITIRKTLTAFELLISKIRAVKGSLAITQANGKIKKVLDQSPVYSLEIDDTMSFASGDLVRCQTWQSTGSKYYWVTVVRVEGNSIICNQAEFNGVVPAVGDELVQMGHVSDASRQSMVYLDASSGRPSIDVLSGINTKSFAGKLKVRLGCLDGITDTDFPSDMQPSGYGLYCTNGFFKGMFVLRSGKTVEDYTGELVDTIQIGVRNLVKNSAINETSNAYGFGHRSLTINLEPGKTYTFVANGRVDQQTLDDNKYLGVYLYQAGWHQQKVLMFNSLADETRQVTFTLSDILPVPDKISSYLHPAEGSRTGKVTINWYMLFEGNKAPDNWIEAPEDTAEKIQVAKDAADKAQTDATTAKGVADAATTRLNDWAADGTISPVEKLALKQEQKALTDEKTQIVSDAAKYAVSSAAYVTAFSNYNAELTYHTASTPENIVIRTSFSTNQAAYYVAKQAVLNAIATAAKKLATDTQSAVGAANEEIVKVKSEISALPGKIELAVTSGISQIEIGGRNYLLGSKFNIENKQSIAVNISSAFIKAANKKHVIVSFDIELVDATTGSLFQEHRIGAEANITYSDGTNYPYTSFWVAYPINQVGINENKRASVGFAFDSNKDLSSILIGFHAQMGSGIARLSNPKLEIGNKATDWTPAPEDSAAALDGVRTELDSRLTITEGNIIQKVSQTDFNALGQRVGTAEASIKTQADKIALTVTKEEFDNLQIGGRNLFLDTQRMENASVWDGSTASMWGNVGNFKAFVVRNNWGRVWQYGKFLPNKTYTISFMVKQDTSLETIPTVISLWTADTPTIETLYSSVPNSSFLPTEFTKIIWVFKTKGDYIDRMLPRVEFYCVDYTKIIPAAVVYAFKVEEGNKATDWTPAPEDTDTKISEMEGRFEIREDQISAKVTEVARKATEASNSAISAAGSAGTAAAKAGEALGSANLAANSYQAVVVKQSEINQTAGNITLQVTEVTEKSAAAINAAELAAAMSKGKMLYRDPTFKDGGNSIRVYNNTGNGNVVIARAFGVVGNPSTSDYCFRITTNGVAQPGLGGFTFLTPTRANAIFVTRFIAKIPVSYNIEFASNPMGDGAKSKWLTSNVGTGNWEEYAVKVKCGSTGSFSNTNYFYIGGGITPLTWYLSYATVFDVTDVDDVPTRDEIKSGIAITPGGIGIFGEELSLQGKVTFSMLAPDSKNEINGKATPGDITSAVDNYNNTIIEGGHIKTGLIEGATLNFTKGTIGGWNIDADSLYSGIKAADGTYATSGMTIRSNGSISSKNFRIDKDGNVFGKNCEFSDGRFTGTVTATSGKIGGFDISSGSLVHSTGTDVTVEEHLFLNTTGISFIYRDKNYYTKKEILAGFGIGSGPSTLGVHVPLWVQNEVKSSTTECYASFFSATGAADPYNNIAIALGGGCISGLAVKVRIIAGSSYLNGDDVFVRSSESNTSNPTYHLPPNPTIGKVIITCNSNRTISVNGNGRIIKANRENRNLIDIGGNTKMAIFIWDGQYWQYNFFNN